MPVVKIAFRGKNWTFHPTKQPEHKNMFTTDSKLIRYAKFKRIPRELRPF